MAERERARDLLHEALARRRGQPIGTPLQTLYARDYPSPTETRTTTFWGDELTVVLPELVSCEMHRHGVIEPDVSALFVDVIAPGTVVYDVGAHLGYYSQLAAFLGARVHAFEPSRGTRALLEHNVDESVVVNPVGLWSEETELRLEDYGPSRSALSTFVSPKDPEAEAESSYDCRVTTVDAYVESTGAAPQLIKIDAEGAELEVLRGAVETMAAARPMITIEVGDAERGESRRALEFATKCGYAPYDLTPEGRRPHQVRDEYSYGNLLLLPRE